MNKKIITILSLIIIGIIGIELYYSFYLFSNLLLIIICSIISGFFLAHIFVYKILEKIQRETSKNIRKLMEKKPTETNERERIWIVSSIEGEIKVIKRLLKHYLIY